jgi:RimJ/RimL family protein N-acetyltransferase
MDSFDTRRLRADQEHLDDLCRMHQDDLVMATLGGLRSGEDTKDYLDRNLAHWRQHGYGLWIFTAKTDGRFVGRGGLRQVHVNGIDEVELAYALRSEFWGQGFATEMARALVKVGTEKLSLKSIVCFTLTSNRASQRVMEKAGFGYECGILYGCDPHVLYRYDVAAEDGK